MDYRDKIFIGDSERVLSTLPDNLVDMCITSPPYYKQRDYGDDYQIGQETSPLYYLRSLLNVFKEVKRVLKPEGSLYINIADKYDKKKSLMMLPERLAMWLVQDGWILRNTIIWNKPNLIPSSAKDKFTPDFEYLYFFVKQRKYYFKQQKEPAKQVSLDRYKYKLKSKWSENVGSQNIYNNENMGEAISDPTNRNKRCVWKIPAGYYKGAHFAVYPERLIETPIKASCPLGGMVLDPFIGSGTTALVAKKLKRYYLGIDINESSKEMTNKRLESL